ncbi:aaa family cdc48 subfamily [Lichtheimia corymbifera JMRC:FSU:9682]|uniref:Aaa family cdc48 subfamily n=1 Tax=Lichtheimia corymbifera JMRC:FSU:9682 TaxID=1263082 RepID=A0A068RSG2_9FUNG|nr:aaa family cdc48 subfamily [Lichtheimia corymbifera JMRC:FSU:9682]
MLVLPSHLTRPATAQASYQLLRELQIQPGDWVRVFDRCSKIAYYCRLWPTEIEHGHVICDTRIQQQHSSSSGTIPANDITPIRAFQLAVNVQVIVQAKGSDQLQIDTLGFCWSKGSETQKTEYIRNLMDGLLVASGIEIVQPTIVVKVISTYPRNIPVLTSPGTRLEIATTEESDEELTGKLQQLNLTAKPTGLEKAYDQLYTVVSYPLLYKDWINELGIECPKGVLLYGPPGVGKTFLVSTVAKACGADLFVIQGSDVVGSFIGESEQVLRQKFNEAQSAATHNHKPVLLFIDEIDALAPHRDHSGSRDNRVVAQLLTLMDGIEVRGRLIVIGATNRPNVIDAALRRPGRFDREIAMEAPSLETRELLFSTCLKTMPIDDHVKPSTLASNTNGYVAADIAAVCREASLFALQRISSQQSMSDFQLGMEDFKVALGRIRPSIQRDVPVQEEKKDWKDIGGLEDVKKNLQQAVEWPLIYKDAFSRLGLKAPRGILLYGPPGCSKTTLVKTIASCSGTAFFTINPAQLYSPYVGDSEKIIRTAFRKARASAPAIIFLDETETMAGKRDMGHGSNGGGGDSVQERVLSTLLNEMDGVETAASVLVVGATNRPDMLDAALLRPGRFDRMIYVPPPDATGRYEILKIHTRSTPLGEDVDLRTIADKTNMYTGADLENLCREAAMMALRDVPYSKYVEMRHFDQVLKLVPPSISQSMMDMYANMQDEIKL